MLGDSARFASALIVLDLRRQQHAGRHLSASRTPYSIQERDAIACDWIMLRCVLPRDSASPGFRSLRAIATTHSTRVLVLVLELVLAWRAWATFCDECCTEKTNAWARGAPSNANARGKLSALMYADTTPRPESHRKRECPRRTQAMPEARKLCSPSFVKIAPDLIQRVSSLIYYADATRWSGRHV